MTRLLERIGLHRPELRAWALYDWANSVFMTSVLQVFPVYFARVAAKGLPPAQVSARFAAATAVAMAVIAVATPVLGALADHSGVKKKLLAAFLGLGVLATGAMSLVGEGDWRLALLLFALGNIGATGSIVFYEALLPHVARPEEVDRVSTAGYSMGYLGSGLLLAVNLAWIQAPQRFGIADAAAATRLTFLASAIWWAAFAIPLFRRVPEPPAGGSGAPGRPLQAAYARLRQTARELRRYRHALLMLLAYLVYNDGANTIIRMGTMYGTEIGLAPGALLGAVLLIQWIGVPCAVLFGMLAGRIGAKRALFAGLAVYVVIAQLGYFMETARDFVALSILVGMAMGGLQALSRSLFATLIPRHKSAELFGFYAIGDKFAGIAGPGLFAAAAGGMGSSRPAILGLVVFFVAGALLLARVDVEAGRAAARDAEAAAGLR